MVGVTDHFGLLRLLPSYLVTKDPILTFTQSFWHQWSYFIHELVWTWCALAHVWQCQQHHQGSWMPKGHRVLGKNSVVCFWQGWLRCLAKQVHNQTTYRDESSLCRKAGKIVKTSLDSTATDPELMSSDVAESQVGMALKNWDVRGAYEGGFLKQTRKRLCIRFAQPSLLSRRVILVPCRLNFQSNGQSSKTGCAEMALLRDMWQSSYFKPSDHLNSRSLLPKRLSSPSCPHDVPIRQGRQLLNLHQTLKMRSWNGLNWLYILSHCLSICGESNAGSPALSTSVQTCAGLAYFYFVWSCLICWCLDSNWCHWLCFYIPVSASYLLPSFSRCHMLRERLPVI